MDKTRLTDAAARDYANRPKNNHHNLQDLVFSLNQHQIMPRHRIHICCMSVS